MIPFVDLKAQYRAVRDDVKARIDRVLEHGAYIMGPEVAELEKELAAFAGVPVAVACSSGTDALVMLLMAKGVGPGDAVLTTPFTFMATAEAIALLGATPVFVDIDPAGFNLDPAAPPPPPPLERAIRAWRDRDRSLYPLPAVAETAPERLKGIISVDLFGLPADMDEINGLAREHGLFHIADAAQSFGADYKGRKAVAAAPMATTSFFPAKPLGCYGDGGAVFTMDPGLEEALRSIRVHGMGSHRYENLRVGLNARLDSIQAAVLLAKLAVFRQELAARQRVAETYDSLLGSLPGLVTPVVPKDRASAWAQYSVLSDRREDLRRALKEAGVPTAVYYPVPLHRQPVFAHLGYGEGDFPVSEGTAARIFSLPMHPYLERDVQTDIARIVEQELGC